jgi:hypothetical protein
LGGGRRGNARREEETDGRGEAAARAAFKIRFGPVFAFVGREKRSEGASGEDGM